MKCAVCDVVSPEVAYVPDRTGLTQPLCPECMPPVDPTDVTHDHRGATTEGPRLLHPEVTGDIARVHVGLSQEECQLILEQRPSSALVLRILKALRLLDAELAAAYARAFDVML